jgi:hypothetical protein
MNKNRLEITYNKIIDGNFNDYIFNTLNKTLVFYDYKISIDYKGNIIICSKKYLQNTSVDDDYYDKINYNYRNNAKWEEEYLICDNIKIPNNEFSKINELLSIKPLIKHNIDFIIRQLNKIKLEISNKKCVIESFNVVINQKYFNIIK